MFAVTAARRASQDAPDEERTSPASELADASHLGPGMENDGYEAGDEDQKSVPDAGKKGEPRGFDDVDLSISAQTGKAKGDVEAATKKPGKEIEEGTGVPGKCFVLLVALLAVGFVVALVLGLTLGHPNPSLDPYQFFQGAVASDHKLCSEVGRDFLKNGGYAIDAAVATAICVGVLNPHAAGIGGGGFMTVFQLSSEGEDMDVKLAIDGQVVAPAGSSKDMFADDPSAASKGGRSIAVPGEVAGLFLAHQHLGGAIPWASLLEPSIRLAYRGFKIGQGLADAIAANEQDILADPYLKEILAEGEVVKRENDMVRLPKLGATLQAIAASGMEAFYKGDLAQQIVDDVKEAGGNITLEDLRSYSTLKNPTVSVELGGGQLYTDGGVTVYAPPPPSCGVLVNYILNILEGYELQWRSVSDTQAEVETYHRMLEAFKFAFAERGRLGDGAFVEEVNNEYTSSLMTSAKGKEIRAMIESKALPFADYGSEFAHQPDVAGGATHISVQDKHGNAVSYTSSISLQFGSKKRGNRTGIMFNAGMGDFTLPGPANADGLSPSEANMIQPGKRPLSSMAPLVLVDNDRVVKAVIGASGGTEMITSTAMMAAQTLWFDENVIDAMKRVRIHSDLQTNNNGDVVYDHEEDLDTAIVSGLSTRGQVESGVQSLPSSVNYIMQTKKNRFYTNSDPRAPDSGYALY